MKKGAVAFEDLLIYGIMITIVIIVSSAFYFLGVFSPGSSLPNTATGFTGLSVSQTCIPDGALAFSVVNTQGLPIEITYINLTTNNFNYSTIPFTSILQPQQSQIFFIKSSCPPGSNTKYSGTAIVTYYTGNSVNPGPYFSSGSYSGTSVSSYKPSYAASFGGSNSIINTSLSYTGTTPITIAFWVKPSGSGSYALISEGYSSSFWTIIDGNPTLWFYSCNGNGNGGSGAFNPNSWNFVMMTISSSTSPLTVQYYLNGKSTINETSFGNQGAGKTYNFGAIHACGASSALKGSMSNVQIYNFSLSISQMETLYLNGIGGAPISKTGLVGWWSLDGNGNDYSGNGNTGALYNISWVSP
jgi:hypothetical protein